MHGNPIELIVGLGNPGPEHQGHRHNAGALFLHELCHHFKGQLRFESKFAGEFGTATIDGKEVRLLFPTTFMNRSGRSVAAVQAASALLGPKKVLALCADLSIY